MKTILRASLFTSVFAAATLVSLAPGAKAETLTFNGTVAESCTFANTSAGTLGTSPDLKILGTGQGVGGAATTELTCNAASAVTINALTFTGVGTDITALGGYTANATVSDGTNTADTAGTNNFAYGADGSTTIRTLNVNLTASATNPIPADDYAYTVDVTAVPNP